MISALLASEDEFGRAEKHAETLAVDHHGLEFRGVQVGRQRVVLVPDVTLEAGDLKGAALVKLRGVSRRRMPGEVHIQIRTVRHFEILEAEDALAIGQPDHEGLALSPMAPLRLRKLPSLH